jgi:hypothetical protein
LSAELLEKTPRDIEESGLPSANVVYNSFVADPIGTVKGIYAQLNWNFSAEYEAILKQFLADDLKKRQSVKAKRGGGDVLHTYTPEEFLLTPEELTVGPKFAAYIKKYNVPMSKN